MAQSAYEGPGIEPSSGNDVKAYLEIVFGQKPGGAWKERVNMDGTEYTVYVGEGYGDGWRYIAFVRTKPQLGAGTLELADFLEYQFCCIRLGL